MSIITFYSYKGGVGRSMALANIAVELARRQKKVLIVDWDLEAPGIERYFSNFKIENSSLGLLQLLGSVENDVQIDYRDFLWDIDTLQIGTLKLLHSGRSVDTDNYSHTLQKFDWNSFFKEKKGGQYLENLRNQWHKDFDFVLIDSRTGLSDSSGICTILMPDILIPMFTANYQSLFGIRDIVKYIETARQKLEVDRMALTILPIPSRFGTRVEFKESQEWLSRIADILKDCYTDWLPAWIEPKYILEQVKIPQIDYFSFGEKLAVIEQGTTDPEGMGYIFSKIATLLISKFAGIEKFVGTQYFQSKKLEWKKNKTTEAAYNFDVFISYSRESYQWVVDLFSPALEEFLADELGYVPSIFLDFNEIAPGEDFSTKTDSAIHKSKVFVIIVTNSLILKTHHNFELNAILQTKTKTQNNSLFPILLNAVDSNILNSYLPQLNQSNMIDFTDFDSSDKVKSTKFMTQFGQKVADLSINIAKSIKEINGNESQNSNRISSSTQSEDEAALIQLAKNYEKVRREMKAGDQRTRVMESIVNNMKTMITNPLTNLDQWTKSSSPGKRLLAIAKLQKFPNQNYLQWLSEHTGRSERPFVGYHAAVALYISTRSFGQQYKIEMNNILESTLRELLEYKNADPNQISVIEAAILEIT